MKRCWSGLRIVATAAVLAVGFVPSSGAAPVSSSAASQSIPLLRVGFGASISNLDPARSFAAGNFYVASLGLEPLVKLAADGTVKPHLARSVRHPTPRTYIYTLRRGVKFWNGNELTAIDAANALNYYRHRQFAVSAQLGYPSVRDIKAVGRYTVVVTLKRRDATWESTPALFGWIFEKRFADANPGTMGRPGVLTMGTGPWKYDSLDPTRSVELSANPNYWAGRVPIQRISIRFIPDITNMALAFRGGEIDFAPSVFDARAFESASGSKVGVIRTCGGFFFSLNVKKAPGDDVHVRRAVAYAINKRDLITAAGAVGAAPSPTLITPPSLRQLGSRAAVNKLLKSLPQYPHNPAKARAEIAMSRYANGASTTIHTISFFAPIVQAIASMLERVGIKTEVRVLSTGQFVSLGAGPRENIDGWFTGLTCIGDPSSVVQAYVHSRGAVPGRVNRANYTNPAADALIDAGQKTTDRAKRLETYRKLLTILARDVPYVPLYSIDQYYALSSRFTFAGLHQFTYYAPGWLLGVKPR